MPDPFRSRIRQALANEALQAALDGNAERRLNARVQAYASLPEDIETFRKRAHALRADTIRNLDRYLKQFAERARANGIIVHHAEDAQAAVQAVVEIAAQSGARLAAKSKTMVGEEIEINRALESAGVRVVETDLGEFIVQLRGERPAHIITPAVHLRRAEVGQTFHEKLGIPLTADIPTLTAAARSVLRQTFLDAELGISGVNFGVAESGTLCLLTNEGNGRMVTTLPRVHIALMGIERLAPSFDDLALLLALLPRSATGQKLTVYASLINGPRALGEVDGAQERHVILVDNGRSRLRRSAISEALYCIRCGACLNICPVFREVGGHAYVGVHGEGSAYPGPIGAVLSPALFGGAEFGNLPRASSLCGACKEACPVDIDLPRLLLRLRAGAAGLPGQSQPAHVPRGLALFLRLYAWAAAAAWRFRAAQWLVGVGGRLLSPGSAWMRLPAFTGWGASRDFPRPATRPFHTRWKGLARRPQPALAKRPGAPTPAASPAAAPPPQDTQALAGRFMAELQAVGGTVERCTEAELPGRVAAWLSARQVQSVLSWEERCLPPGLLAALKEAGLRITHRPDPQSQAGLTGAQAGVADTGSLLIAGGPGRPQTASMLPAIHLAVLRLADLKANLPQALALQEVRDATMVALVSGPSRTADIEMTLTIGVHGPQEVHVFLFD